MYKSEKTGITNSAWSTLALGRYNDAINNFAEEAQNNPNAGVPKVGYALATASGGDLPRGIWAMRRAFRIDPNSLHNLQLKESGRILIEQLMDQYSIQKNTPETDQAFMVAALQYLKHDYVAAKKSILNAQKYGDQSSSFTNLQSLINRELAGQKIKLSPSKPALN